METLEEKAYEFSKNFRKVTPLLFMRKFHLTYDGALNLCCTVWHRNHLEARKLAKEIENNLL